MVWTSLIQIPATILLHKFPIFFPNHPMASKTRNVPHEGFSDFNNANTRDCSRNCHATENDSLSSCKMDWACVYKSDDGRHTSSQSNPIHWNYPAEREFSSSSCTFDCGCALFLWWYCWYRLGIYGGYTSSYKQAGLKGKGLRTIYI